MCILGAATRILPHPVDYTAYYLLERATGLEPVLSGWKPEMPPATLSPQEIIMPHPRNPKNWCPCGKHIKNSASGLCKACWADKQAEKYGERKLSDLPFTAARHRHQNVRNHAHRVMARDKRPRVCEVCGYSHHVELAHIKPISSFSSDTLVKIINHPSNLKWLCPNHHWEQENLQTSH